MKTTISRIAVPGFAGRLRALREKSGLTQADLAGVCGLTGQWISHFESGRRMPTVKHLVSLAEAFGVSTDWLLGRE